MGLKTCEIFFDNQWATYYVGQTVNGNVTITLDSPKKVRGVSICFKGEAQTKWTIEEVKTNNDGKQENELVDLTGSEDYFKIKYFLVGGQGGDIELPIGKHTYPFTCVLPPTLPSSFEGEYGFIRYTVKVTLDRPWKFDQETKAAFTVLSPVDLNLNPRLREPVRITLEKYFCCCWCKSGPLTCVISLPRSGYVPGETIPIVAELDNASNVEVLNINFSLFKVVTYHSQFVRRETKKDDVLVAELQVGPVAPHSSNTWNQPLVVPPLPPSNLINCSVIDLDYELRIEVRVSGYHTNMDAKIPFTIGNIPLSNVVHPSAPDADSVAVNIPPAVEGTIGWINSHGDKLPEGAFAFAKSPFGTNSIQDKNDNEYTRYSNNSEQYTPWYPVLNVSASNPPQ